MVLAIAGFELQKRLRRLSSWVYFVLFLALGFLATITAGGAFEGFAVGIGNGGKVYVNSPQAIFELASLLGTFGLLVTAAAFGQAVCQDFESNSQALFFTMPVKERAYLVGRFLGALGFLAIVYLSIAIGMWIGARMPFVERSLFGPDRAAAYLWPYAVSVLPNLVIFGSLFFAVVAWTRKMLPVYVGGIVLFMGYLMAGALMHDIEHRTVAALVDPFGGHAFSVVTRYFSIAEKNTQLVPLRGLLLANRLLWLGLSTALLAFTVSRFRYADDRERARPSAAPPAVEAPALIAPSVAPTRSAPFSLMLQLTWLSFAETVKHVFFFVILLSAALFSLVSLGSVDTMFGTHTYPVTYAVLETVGGSFGLFMLILVTLYSGELVWRERDARIDQLVDTLPIPTWVPFAAKLLALMLMQAIPLLVVMVCGVAWQTAHGFHHYELGLYVKELFGLRLVGYFMLCALAMSVHVLVQHKYLGHFIMVLYFLVSVFLGKLGVEHNLLRLGQTPSYTYSDMNGYIHYNKGSLVMYALQDYLGEAVVNRVLAEYVAAVKFQQPPYTSSVELVERLRAVAPPELRYLIVDLLETITLYDNRALEASVTKVGARFSVRMKVLAHKVRAGELGEEEDVPMNDLVPIGALDDKGESIFLEKRRLKAGEQEITFELDREPAKVGIDPLNELIDRVPDDNIVAPKN